MRVGLHARNAVEFKERDYALLQEAKAEALLVMSFTSPTSVARVAAENPGIEFLGRLYTGGFARGSRPGPTEFVANVLPQMADLSPWIKKWQIHNEPNHVDGIEGWGNTDGDARSFKAWYMLVLGTLREAAPWARLGFPGLANGAVHRDLKWLDICQEAIWASDWLGCHCYWQYQNVLADMWGLRFKRYHAQFPNNRIHITEFGDSTPGITERQMASRYVRYYQECMAYSYLGSVCSFIASSPDPAWEPFAWMKESGEYKLVVSSVAAMDRAPQEFRVIDMVHRLHRHKRKRPPIRDLSEIKNITIHHTAIGANVPINNIAKYCVRAKDFPRISYHAVIKPSGTIVQTSDLEMVTYHADGTRGREHVGQNNWDGIALAFAGSFMKGRRPTDAQLDAGRWYCQVYIPARVRRLPIKAHYELPDLARPTACPGTTFRTGNPAQPGWETFLL